VRRFKSLFVWIFVLACLGTCIFGWFERAENKVKRYNIKWQAIVYYPTPDTLTYYLDESQSLRLVEKNCENKLLIDKVFFYTEELRTTSAIQIIKPK
jgi:hypothetical protein